MPNQTEAALSRHWAILIALIAQIGRLLDATKMLRSRQRNRLLHLIRVAESMSRRWLILNARVLGSTKVRSQTRQTEKWPKGAERPPVAGPLLRLVEPNPTLRPEDFSLEPFEPKPAPHLVQGTDALQMPALALTHRLLALRDLMARPGHHTARMARWLRRAADRARTTLGRLHPLRVGRPPGAQRRAKSCPQQAALWWLDTLARDSLQPGWVP